MLPLHVYDSAACQQLNPAARAVLLELIRRHNGVNNGHIAFPVRDGKRLGIGQSITSRAIGRLVDAGLITREARSGFNLKTRKAAEYGLAWLQIDGRSPTLGYRDIPKPEVKHSPATDADSPATEASMQREAA